MADPLKRCPHLLMKLGSIIVHSDEFLSPKGHEFDRLAILSGLADKEVQQWIIDMGVYLPVKRSCNG